MALVVIHGYNDVEVAALCQEEKGVGGERTDDVPTATLTSFDGWTDLVGFLAAAKETVLASVGVDAADADSGFGDTAAHKRCMGAGDGAFDQSGFDLLDGVE
jgi:hypothetical protein